MTVEENIKRLQTIMDSIKPNKITVLTGSNGSGKSLIRKQLCFRLSKKIENSDYRRLIAEVSMQKRTESVADWGALSTCMHDVSWVPTSCSTYDLINSMFNTFLKEDSSKRYLIIDEPEIGMSKEAQMGLATYIINKIPDILKYTYGLLIITHSEVLVDALKDKVEFFNIDKDCTAEEWLNREIVPLDLEELAKKSNELYHAILEYSKEKE